VQLVDSDNVEICTSSFADIPRRDRSPGVTESVDSTKIGSVCEESIPVERGAPTCKDSCTISGVVSIVLVPKLRNVKSMEYVLLSWLCHPSS
jgi:hypothetical protein